MRIIFIAILALITGIGLGSGLKHQSDPTTRLLNYRAELAQLCFYEGLPLTTESHFCSSFNAVDILTYDLGLGQYGDDITGSVKSLNRQLQAGTK